jgi:methylenetetrahydrofolate dehydrogenase (NADP+) / methenyltetrahydrofolate cyclohydrolase
MTAIRIDGVALAQTVYAQVTARAAVLSRQGCAPQLAVILVGDDPASAVYVRNKVRACTTQGVASLCHRYPDQITEAELLQNIDTLNRDPSVHGILVQMPLPPHIDSHLIMAAITPDKDVDGFHPMNAGALMTGRPRLLPCTPYGIMMMLSAMNIPLAGATAVVIGCSNIVGKPMALLLLKADATVTLCHRKTVDLAIHTRAADIVIAAAGHPRLLTADMVKPGATVIDVGINRDPAGILCGDVDFVGVSKVAGYITPVPGGVGPMTIATLLMNTIIAAEAIHTLATHP